MLDAHPWIRNAAIVLGIVVATLVAHRVLYWVARRSARKAGFPSLEVFVGHSLRPALLIFLVLAGFLTLPALPLPPDSLTAARHVLGLVLIGGVAWLVIGLSNGLAKLLASRYDATAADNLAARRVQTRIHVLRHWITVVVVVLALMAALLTFPTLRQVGVSLFASAGLAGLIIGLAARPTLSNLIAGAQIALTEPIRLDDVVIVEGEWGWIEEITTTYVVVRIWDLRRLILPLSYFMEKPFQNWTRISADLLGTVNVYADYTVSVAAVREALHRILQESGMWDGKVWNLQVTNATEHTLELRALMSAKDSGVAWDLRCHVREKLVEFLQSHYPQSLPRTRVELPERGSRTAEHGSGA